MEKNNWRFSLTTFSGHSKSSSTIISCLICFSCLFISPCLCRSLVSFATVSGVNVSVCLWQTAHLSGVYPVSCPMAAGRGSSPPPKRLGWTISGFSTKAAQPHTSLCMRLSRFILQYLLYCSNMPLIKTWLSGIMQTLNMKLECCSSPRIRLVVTL